MSRITFINWVQDQRWTSPRDVRTWAKFEGIEVKDKSRVPAEMIVRFK